MGKVGLPGVMRDIKLNRMRRPVQVFLALGLLATSPGCLAAAVGGGAYLLGKSAEKKAEIQKARLDYLQRRRAAGATDEQILAEIRATDPEWAKEIEKAGGKLEARK